MSVIHHSAVCVRDVDASLRFWRDGLGFEVMMDERFDGDWPTLLGAASNSLRAVFLGDRAHPESGIVELVDLGSPIESVASAGASPRPGVLLLSIMTDVDAVLGRLAELGLGGTPQRIEVSGVGMAVVIDPDGVLVELVDTGATANLGRLARSADIRP